MFSSARSPSQMYQVATVCGEPSDLSEATTAGLGRRRNASISEGSGSGGTPRSYHSGFHSAQGAVQRRRPVRSTLVAVRSTRLLPW
jgi:hypothetical protein